MNIDTMPARTLSRWVHENRGYTIDEKTIRDRRRKGMAGEALIAKPRQYEGRVRRSMWPLLTHWGRPVGIDDLLGRS